MKALRIHLEELGMFLFLCLPMGVVVAMLFLEDSAFESRRGE